MADSTTGRHRRGPATAETAEALHHELNALWAEAAYVSDPDRMAFTLAVIEAANNVVAHAVPADHDAVELAADLTATPSRVQARLYEINAAPARVDLDQQRPMNGLAESGRGLDLIHTLVDNVTFERCEDINVWILCQKSSSQHR